MGLGAHDGERIALNVPRGVRALWAFAAYVMTAAALSAFGPYARVEVMARRAGLPETRPGVSAAGVSIFLGRIGEEGRSLYTLALALDFALPLLMALAAWALLSWARAFSAPRLLRSATIRLTILAVAAEVFENTVLLIAAARYPAPPLLGNLIGPLVTGKFALIVLTGVSALSLTFGVLRARSRRPPLDHARAAYRD